MVVLLSQHARPRFTPYEHGSSPVHPQGKREIAKRCGGGCFDHFLLLWQGSCTRTPQIRLSIRGLWVFYEISDGSLVPPMTCLFDSSSDPWVERHSKFSDFPTANFAHISELLSGHQLVFY